MALSFHRTLDVCISQVAASEYKLLWYRASLGFTHPIFHSLQPYMHWGV